LPPLLSFDEKPDKFKGDNGLMDLELKKKDIMEFENPQGEEGNDLKMFKIDSDLKDIFGELNEVAESTVSNTESVDKSGV
jgi:hypothetical protein